jgi:hypothetical protein
VCVCVCVFLRDRERQRDTIQNNTNYNTDTRCHVMTHVSVASLDLKIPFIASVNRREVCRKDN